MLIKKKKVIHHEGNDLEEDDIVRLEEEYNNDDVDPMVKSTSNDGTFEGNRMSGGHKARSGSVPMDKTKVIFKNYGTKIITKPSLKVWHCHPCLICYFIGKI